ncbi:MAG: CocE/NonD family hydrolase [Halobacteriales archaeon]|nr:CocE/NonD family hydrolase [Halobacteriales archaeon]
MAAEPAPGPGAGARPGHALRLGAVRVRAQRFRAAGPALPVIYRQDGYAGADVPTHYVRMRDGVLVAVRVAVDDATAPRFLNAQGSVRGTGCSGGQFDLFQRAEAFDGREVIERLAHQPWSTGKVGMVGSSYSAHEALLTASTRPPSLVAVAASASSSDLYRDVAYPGGILDEVFTLGWSQGVRPSAEEQSVLHAVEAQDDLCAQDIALRGAASPADNILISIARPTDGPWYQARDVGTYIGLVQVPTLLSVAWQDEEIAPRGALELFRDLHPEPILVDGKRVEPKWLLGTNGVHFTSHASLSHDTPAWFDHWLRGVDNGIERRAPVELRFDAVGNYTRTGYAWNGTLALDALPAAGTTWQRLFLRVGQGLSGDAPASEPGDTYLGGVPRENWLFDAGILVLGEAQPTDHGPALLDLRDDPGDSTALVYRTAPLEQATTLAGPVTASLWLSTTATDADLFVSIADVQPDGKLTYLARGLLRASHRALDEQRTLRDAQGDVVRPWHPHTNPQPVVPGEPQRVEVEVLPFAHVLYPGHRLQLVVMGPPLLDGLWGYVSTAPPAPVTVLDDAAHPSSLLVPLVAWPGPLPPEPACGTIDGYACVRPRT